MKVVGFVNFDLGGYLLQNGIAGLKLKQKNRMTTVEYGIGQTLRQYSLFYSTINLKHRKKANTRLHTYFFEQYALSITFNIVLQLILYHMSLKSLNFR